MRIVAYTYEADCHCVQCAIDCFHPSQDVKRHDAEIVSTFGKGLSLLDENGIPIYKEDREGNKLHPVFSTDEIPSTHCGTCGERLE
jgi:hypothetical protein